jgi:cell division protein FtsB
VPYKKEIDRLKEREDELVEEINRLRYELAIILEEKRRVDEEAKTKVGQGT